MKFKRCALVPDRLFVNAGVGAVMLFLTACGSGDPPETDNTPRAAPEEPLTLPAVWNTTSLEGDVSDIALAGGGASTLAIAYQEGGVELFNLEGDRITAIAPISVLEISNGAIMQFGDLPLTLFPALDENRQLSAILYGDGLETPQLTSIDSEIEGGLRYLCSRATDTDGISTLEVAFAADSDPSTLIAGQIIADASALTFEVRATKTVGPDTQHCTFFADDVIAEVQSKATDSFVREEGVFFLRVDADGSLEAGRTPNAVEPIVISDGISVRAPAPARAMAALGTPRGGGYPNGVVVLTGRVGNADQAVFIDTTPLVEGDNTSSAAGD